MCLFAFVEVIAFLWIVPETKGKPMPDRMPEEEDTSCAAVAKSFVDKNSGERVPLSELSEK